MKITKLFFDFEFTGLYQNCQAISLGIISDDGNAFYAEFTDFNKSECNQWVQENVLPNLHFQLSNNNIVVANIPSVKMELNGDTEFIRARLKEWIDQFDIVEFYGDVLAYDWVLLCNLFGTLPQNVKYIPFDISTIMKMKGIDSDVNREEFSGVVSHMKHNALVDAIVTRECYCKLMEI